MERDFCVMSSRKPGGAGGNFVPHVRDFAPFVSPQRLAMGCSCINGSDDTKFRCSPPYDDDQHGHPFVPRKPASQSTVACDVWVYLERLFVIIAGGFCSFDVFAGGLWSQRLKQYLLNNGIAIVEANSKNTSNLCLRGCLWFVKTSNICVSDLVV
jgi:hypothetical protein